jgi:hypothetical protein
MENSSKALIMAGEILIGILILTMGAMWIVSLREVTDSYETSMSALEIERFNTYFTKFEERDNIKAQEIVTVIHYAQEFNGRETGHNITVRATGYIGSGAVNNTSDNNRLMRFIEENMYEIEPDGRIKKDVNGDPIHVRFKIQLDYSEMGTNANRLLSTIIFEKV